MNSNISSKATNISAIDENSMAAEKPTVILVHGAFSNGQVWGYVAAKLQAAGHPVVTVDLPGRPGAPMSPEKVSLDLYRDTVVQALNGVSRPAILVGHSFAGITIAAVAEQAPEKIKTMVFVAAYLPKDGDSLVSLAQQDPDAKIGPHLQIQKEQGLAVVEYSARAELFANDGPAPLKAKLPDLILDEPLVPLVSAVHVTDARFGQVDKVYVHTSLDQVISPCLPSHDGRRHTGAQHGHPPDRPLAVPHRPRGPGSGNHERGDLSSLRTSREARAGRSFGSAPPGRVLGRRQSPLGLSAITRPVRASQEPLGPPTRQAVRQAGGRSRAD